MAERSRDRFRDERARRFAAIKAGTSYNRNLLLAAIPGVALGLVLAAAVGLGAGLVAAIAGAIAGPAIYHWILWKRGSDEAELAVMQEWASERGWAYIQDVALPDDVAFCRDKQKPRATDGFAGPMCGLDGLIFNFTYSTYETRTRTVTDANGNVRTETYQQEVKHYHTVLRLGLGVIPGIPTMQLSEKRFALFDKLVAALGPSRVEETESSEFNDKFRLLVADSADEIVVKRVFTPALIVQVVQGSFPQTTFQFEDSALSFIWQDQYNVEELEEIEQRVADVTPLTAALTRAVQPLQAPVQTASNP